jgi:hypothetical protein
MVADAVEIVKRDAVDLKLGRGGGKLGDGDADRRVKEPKPSFARRSMLGVAYPRRCNNSG